MSLWVYRKGSSGKVERALVSERKKLAGEPRPDSHFSETVLRGYYNLEQEQGSRFRSGYTKGQLKRVHETALARFNELGVES